MNLQTSPPAVQRGFTFMELMVVIAITGIVAALAMPSFNQALTRNRIVAQTNELIASFSYARLEGMRRNLSVGVCALNAAATGCATDDWSRGWLVWADTNSDGAFTAADEVLRINELDQNSALVGSVLTINFGARGTRNLPVASAAAPTLVLQPNDCYAGSTNVRTLTVRSSGSASSAESACP